MLSLFTAEAPVGTTSGSNAYAGSNASADSTGTNTNKEATGNESLPPSGYIVAGKMRIGSISVPAPNSAHLRRESGQKTYEKSPKTLPPFRSESINSNGSSRSSQFQLPTNQLSAVNQLLTENLENSSISERESISPHRLLLPHEEVIKNSQLK